MIDDFERRELFVEYLCLAGIENRGRKGMKGIEIRGKGSVGISVSTSVEKARAKNDRNARPGILSLYGSDAAARRIEKKLAGRR